MAVAIDVTGPTAGNSFAAATSFTVAAGSTLTVGSGANRVLAAFISFSGNPGTVTVNWDTAGTNQAMTLVTSHAESDNLAYTYIYGLIAPASGNLAFRFTTTNSVNAACGFASFTGADQGSVATTFINTTFVANSPAANGLITVTVTSPTGDMGIAGFASNLNGFAVGGGTLTGTSIYYNSTNVTGAARYLAGTGTAAISITSDAASGRPIVGVGCDIAAVGTVPFVSIDATGPTAGNSFAAATSFTIAAGSTLTVGGGANRVLAACIAFSADPGTVAVHWDTAGTNQAMILVASQAESDNLGFAYLYGLIAPTSGNLAFQVTTTNSVTMSCGFASFTGADQGSVTTTFKNTTSVAVTPAANGLVTLTITSPTGDMGIASFAANLNGFSGTGTPTGTLIYRNITNVCGAARYLAGNGTSVISMNASGVTNRPAAGVGCDIAAVGTVVAVDATGTAFTGGATTTFTTSVSPITVGSGLNRILLVFIQFGGLPGAVTTAAWDPAGTNQALTQVGSNVVTSSNLGTAAVYAVIAPTSGAKQLKFTWTNSVSYTVGCISFNGADQGSVVGTCINIVSGSPATKNAVGNNFPYPDPSGTTINSPVGDFCVLSGACDEDFNTTGGTGTNLYALITNVSGSAWYRAGTGAATTIALATGGSIPSSPACYIGCDIAAAGTLVAGGGGGGAITLSDVVLDNGLSYIHTNADQILVIAGAPTSYADAVSKQIGVMNFGAGSAVGSPAAGSPSGRIATTTAVTAGSVTATGTPDTWAIVNSAGSELLAYGPLTGGVASTSGGAFSLNSFAIHYNK